MSKIRATIVVEYECNIENYPGCNTVKDAAAMDQNSFEKGHFDEYDALGWGEGSASVKF